MAGALGFSDQKAYEQRLMERELAARHAQPDPRKAPEVRFVMEMSPTNIQSICNYCGLIGPHNCGGVPVDMLYEFHWLRGRVDEITSLCPAA